MNWYYLYPLLIAAGILCGFINTLAGCGGAIALTVLNMFMPINIANGTFRIPVLLQNVFAVHEFRKFNIYDKKSSLPIIIPMGIGGVFGAVFGIYIPHDSFKVVIGVIMLLLFILQTKKLLNKKTREVEKIELINKYIIIKYIAFFIVGFYGGFVQIGIGVVSLVAIETFAKMDLFKANAIKLLGILCFTIPVTVIFMCHGLILFKIGIVMGIGNIIGVKIAIKSASRVNPKYIRLFLILILFSAGIYYTGLSRLMF
jgi:uncharacterized protein